MFSNLIADIMSHPIVLQMHTYMPHVMLAIALGAGIGLERRHHNKIAGVRTHLLVCVSSCIITLMGAMIVKSAGVGDATRIAGQILPALGFIGMGVISRKGWTTSGVVTRRCSGLTSFAAELHSLGCSPAGTPALASAVPARTLLSFRDPIVSIASWPFSGSGTAFSSAANRVT